MSNFLSYSNKNPSGRNNTGRITLRHRGGGNVRRKLLSFADYSIFYNSNFLSVLADRDSSLFVSPLVRQRSHSEFFSNSPASLPVSKEKIYRFFRLRAHSKFDFPKILRSNFYFPDFGVVPIHLVPVGQYISHVSDFTKHSKFARSYGSAAQLLRLRGSFATIRLPSGEVRKIFAGGMCVPTQTYKSFKRIKIYKAGQNRWKGIRPHVRGAAINPVDHPHGGRTGESRPSVSPWAILTKGYKTRTKPFNKKFIVLSVRQFKNRKKLLMRDYKYHLPWLLFFKNRNFHDYILYARRARPALDLIGTRIHIYTGKELKQVLIKSEMIGHSLGSFVSTKFTGSGIHYRKKKKSKPLEYTYFLTYGY